MRPSVPPIFRRGAALLLLALSSAAAGRADGTLNFGPPYVSTGAFNRPFAVALDETHGRVIVADTGHRRLKWTGVSTVTGTVVWSEFGYVASPSDASALNGPQALAVNAAGDVYVVNTLQGHVKRFPYVGPGYGPAETFPSPSSHTVAGLGIDLPRDIAVGPDGAVYLLDSGNKRILKANPGDTAWSFYRGDSSWNNPYGLAVSTSGSVFVADTGNHRIVKMTAVSTTTFGHWGTGLGEFRFPRDVAEDGYGRIFVADTVNHRVQVLGPDGHGLRVLGHAPAIRGLQKVVVDAQDRVFAVNSDRDELLAFLGESVPAPFDAFVRDYVSDAGLEPSSTFYMLSSPDVLVRHNPDVNLATAALVGLESYAFQQPRYGENNYVYVAIRNRGLQPAVDNFIKLYWYDPAGAGIFPADWRFSGFYRSYSDAAHNDPSNQLSAPLVPGNGVTVVGPLLWRPPHPDTVHGGDGQVRLTVRVVNPYDFPPADDSATQPRDSNNVSERPAVIQRGPFTTGEQDTLVVRVHFSDKASVTDPAMVTDRAQALADWVKETSWNEARINVLQRGPITPPHPESFYTGAPNSPLVELPQDVLSALAATEPGIFGSSGEAKDVGRLVLVTNDLGSHKDWATTGLWPYVVNGSTRYFSVSVQAADNALPLYAHGMSHQFGMMDLYAHEHVTFSRPYADGWDNMAKPMTGVHPLVWSKELAYWVTDHDAKILFVPRPLPGATWNNGGQPVHLNFQTIASSQQVVGVAFGLTNGVTSFTDETAFYYVECRKSTGTDAAIPQQGVVMYYANKQIPQGQGPVILRDHVPGGDLHDAAIPVGASEAPGGTGINVTVHNGTAGGDYDLSLQYNPPAIDYDVYMNPGDPPWASPDIWVDNQRDNGGYNAGPPADQGEQGIAGEENRVYAKVSNHGPASAFDVEVAYFFSQPYHTLEDGEAAFDEFSSTFVDEIPSLGAATPYVAWTPETGVEPHTCALVQLRRLFNDTNAADDKAQRNLQIDHSVHGSPYTPVQFRFQVRNDTDTARLIYFRVDDMPKTWTWSISPKKAYLAPGAAAVGTLFLKPPDTTEECASRRIFVTGWEARGDTLVRLGGTTVQVDLQGKTALRLKVGLKSCDKEKEKPRTNAAGASAQQPRHCVRLVAEGCTVPKRTNEDVTVRYEGPDGKVVYHTVHTGMDGCFQDELPVVEGGDWNVQADYPGSDCSGPAHGGIVTTVPLPTQDHPEPAGPDDRKHLCLRSLSWDAKGEIRSIRPENAKGRDCPMTSFADALGFKVEGKEWTGKLEIEKMRQVLSGKDQGAGLQLGRFRLTTENAMIVGEVRGLVDVGTHHKPAFAGKTEPPSLPRHWELFLDGVVVRGPALGQRLRATALVEPEKDPAAGVSLRAALEGVLEKDCDLSEAALKARVARAMKEAAAPAGVPCPDGLPCLGRLSKAGEGRLLLDRTAVSRCGGAQDPRRDDKDACRSLKSWSRLEVPLKHLSIEPSAAPLADGTLLAPAFFQAVGPDGRGEHGGLVEVLSKEKKVLFVGRMEGVTRGGSHRKPLSAALEDPAPEGHMEGRLIGFIATGPWKGTAVEARYALQTDPVKPEPSRKGKRDPSRNGRLSVARMNVDGWAIRGCLQSPGRPEQVTTTTTSAPPDVRPRPRPTALPDKLYRPLSEIPAAVRQAYARAVGKMTPDDERRLRIEDRTFRLADVNQDGKLSAAEFAAPFHPRDEKDFLKGESALLDKNKDGRITAKDNPKAWEKLSALDADKSGDVSGRELERIPARSAERAFAAADKDKDGSIGLAEFVLWRRQQPSAGIKP